MIHLSGVKRTPDSKSLIWLSGVTEWCLVSSAWVFPDRSGSESQQCPTREAPPLAANTDFYTVTWAVRAHDTAYFAFSHSNAHTRSHTDGGGCNRRHQPVNQDQFGAENQPADQHAQINFLSASGLIYLQWSRVQNSAKLVWPSQTQAKKLIVSLGGAKWQQLKHFFGMLSKSETCSQGKKEWKNLTEWKAVNVQLRGRILTNHMGLPAVTATGSSCRCRSLRGAAWLFPAGNAQVSRKPHRRGCRGRRPAAKESRLESEGPAEERIDTRLNQVTKPKKQKQKNKTTICFGLFICAWH